MVTRFPILLDLEERGACNAGALTSAQAEGLGSDWLMLAALQVDPKEPPLAQLPRGKPARAPWCCLEKEVMSRADRMKAILEMLKGFPVKGLPAHMFF